MSVVSQDEFLDKTVVGQRLREARGNLTQEAVAKVLGVDPRTISQYERGKGSPTLETLIRFQKLTRVSLDWLATGLVEGASQLDADLLCMVIDKVERTVPSASPAEKANLITQWYVDSIAARAANRLALPSYTGFNDPEKGI